MPFDDVSICMRLLASQTAIALIALACDQRRQLNMLALSINATCVRFVAPQILTHFAQYIIAIKKEK